MGGEDYNNSRRDRDELLPVPLAVLVDQATKLRPLSANVSA